MKLQAHRSHLLIGLSTLLAVGCTPPLHDASEPEGATAPAAPVFAGKTTYAAMKEVPVSGGELRLGEEIELEVEVEVDIEVDVDGEPGNNDEPGERRVVTAIAYPLEHTDVSVEVDGMVALYTVTQRFSNPFDSPLEAVYVFPLGASASVTDYQIEIGDRTIEGVVKEREEARRMYREAKASGHTAALLEQDKPNVFSQRVANIAPRESISVTFRYVEMLEYKDNRYELVYPMVVGPRYLPRDRPGRNPVAAHREGSAPVTGATSIPYASAERASQTISFRARIDAGVPISATSSPSHELVVKRTGETTREVALREHDNIPNRDLILRYSAAGNRTMVGMLTHRDKGDGFFSLVIQPKVKYRRSDIVGREVIILIDRSGSMNGRPLAQAKALGAAMVETLGAGDVFNVIAFASGTAAMSPHPIAGTPDARAAGVRWINSIDSGGATEMERGMLKSLATEPGNDRVRMIYLLSDGFVGNDDMILGAAQKYLGHNRIFPIGVGSAPNRHLFDRLADVGRGFSSYLAPAEDAGQLATNLVRRSAHPYLTDIEIDWAGLDVLSLTPMRIPDVYAGMPLVISGRYRKPGMATIKLRANGGGRRVEIPLPIILSDKSQRPAVSYLWANQRITEILARDHGNVSAEVKREVTELGMQFQMVTAYTSFIAVDRSRVVEGGKPRTVVQPVPSPDGVNLDAAIGPASQAPARRSRSSSRSSRSSRSSWGGGWGGGGGGGGDVDPFTLLYFLLILPVIVMLRRTRTRRDSRG